MGLTLTEKIIYAHTDSIPEKGKEFYLRIDNTLTQDATGTMAYLEFMSMGIDKVKAKRSVSYIDHNTLQNGFENADDHEFLKTVADKYGIYFSKCGNGICHQVQLERFSIPTLTLLGSDSHTPTSGGLGTLSIGAGGLDVALAMAGKPFKMIMPEIVNVKLTGKLKCGVTAKDIILEVLRRKTVKGGVNKVFEYTGDGIKYLTVPERATICNMGAELGATTSIFPSDEVTKDFLRREGRESDFIELSSDSDAIYDEIIEIDLSNLDALAACPSMPDNVKKIKEIEGTKVDQVLVGSCTNSSYLDMMMVASILKNKKIHKDVSFAINPGSKQVLSMMVKNGLLFDILASGARILECTCGACIGMGQSPKTNAISLRTYNRNFYGRSGTLSANVYLVSPVTAALSAVNGYITDPTDKRIDIPYEYPDKFIIDDSMIIKPTFKSEIAMGPNIMALPKFDPLKDRYEIKVVLKTKDDITTDDIMPAGSKILPYRSNIEKLSDYTFYNIDKDFKKKAKEYTESVIIGGLNYGQGSSREHAAISPRYLGVRAVLAKSFARIHRQNLMNFGIVPIVINDDIYSSINEGDTITLDFKDLDKNIVKVCDSVINTSFTESEIKMLKKGGLLNTI
ncbi:aconitate hydratase [bacterium]|nr:aconitate hydratase [bacterium]